MKEEVLLSEQLFYDCNLPEEIEGYKLIEVSDDIYRYEKINKKVLTLELNMNYICKDTIKKRKSLYGNNFKEISKMQSEYLGIKVTEKDVAMNLAILKKVRIDFIKSKLQEFRNNPRFNDYDIQIQIKDLNSGLEDSQKDMMNYLFIALNYEEYESL